MNVIPFRPRSPLTRELESPIIKSTNILAIGIDLGTTHTVVSKIKQGERVPISLEYDGALLIPSVLYWSSESHQAFVGIPAKRLALSHPHELIRSSKRSMGQRYAKLHSRGQSFTPEDVATHLLKHVLSHSEIQSDESSPVAAVVTVPAHFQDAARQATLSAAEAAGLKVLRIINEPTAAALAYSLLPDVDMDGKETLVVYDFGGGTFDVSVVERDGLVFHVLSSEGDVELGGDDVDAALAEALLGCVQVKPGRLISAKDPRLYDALLRIAEKAKISLEDRGTVHIFERDLDGHGSSIDMTLTRETFEEVIRPVIEKTLLLTSQAMAAARRKPHHISRILLVGGSSRLPLVRRMLEFRFPSCSVDARLQPDLAVSWGASLQASIILGQNPSTILVDVCSHSLGIGVVEDARAAEREFQELLKEFGVHTIGGKSTKHIGDLLGDRIEDFEAKLRARLKVARIIPRNSSLPAKKSEFFNTLYDNQPAVQVMVSQGEGNTLGENTFIGSFLFQLQQPCPAGTQCEIQLTYDANGMVKVFANQLGTENVAKAVFDSRTGQVLGWEHFEGDTGLNQAKNESLSEEIFSPIVNTFTVKAQRFLDEKILSETQTLELYKLLKDYQLRLHEASQGKDVDNQLEELELKIEDLCRGLV